MEVNKEGYIKLSFKKGYNIYYQHQDNGKIKYYLGIDAVKEFTTKSNIHTDYIGDVLFRMDYELTIFSDMNSEKIRKKTLVTGGFSYLENPLYRAADRSGDERLKLLIKIHYNALTNEECEEASKTLGYRILPALENMNRDLYVKRSTIDGGLLARSGYRILHTPNFAMYNRTRDAYRINPATKIGADSAKKDGAIITFEEFLSYFD